MHYQALAILVSAAALISASILGGGKIWRSGWRGFFSELEALPVVFTKGTFMKNTLKTRRNERGFTLIELMIVIAIIGILIGAAVVGWQAANRSGNEAATIQNLKTIAAVQIQYYNTHSRTFGTFEQLTKEEFLSSKFSGNPPVTDGYLYTLNVTPKSANSSSSYTLNADPVDTRSGTNHFYIDSNDSSIHVNASQPAGSKDPVP